MKEYVMRCVVIPHEFWKKGFETCCYNKNLFFDVSPFFMTDTL